MWHGRPRCEALGGALHMPLPRLGKESAETDFGNECGLNLGQEPGPVNLRLALTSLEATDLLAALCLPGSRAGERLGRAGGCWGCCRARGAPVEAAPENQQRDPWVSGRMRAVHGARRRNPGEGGSGWRFCLRPYRSLPQPRGSRLPWCCVEMRWSSRNPRGVTRGSAGSSRCLAAWERASGRKMRKRSSQQRGGLVSLCSAPIPCLSPAPNPRCHPAAIAGW